MLARILRWLLTVQLLLGVGLAVLGARLLHSVWLGSLAALLVILLIRSLIIFNHFRLSWRERAADAPRLPWLRVARMLVAEWGASMLCWSWHMAWPRVGAYHGGTGLPLLLVHGYGCNRGYWAACSAMLRRAGISYAALDCEPLTASIDSYAATLQHAIAALCAASGSERVILLGHSMGGLTIRAYLRAHGSARIAHVITLGTPHHGTALAHFGIGQNARQMTRSGSVPSAWLTALAAAEEPSRRALFTSIYSQHDNIVLPASSCHLPGAKNIALSGIGHVALGTDARVLQCLLEELRLIHRASLVA